MKEKLFDQYRESLLYGNNTQSFEDFLVEIIRKQRLKLYSYEGMVSKINKN